jgi:hypothetical protein
MNPRKYEMGEITSIHPASRAEILEIFIVKPLARSRDEKERFSESQRRFPKIKRFCGGTVHLR